MEVLAAAWRRRFEWRAVKAASSWLIMWLIHCLAQKSYLAHRQLYVTGGLSELAKPNRQLCIDSQPFCQARGANTDWLHRSVLLVAAHRLVCLLLPSVAMTVADMYSQESEQEGQRHALHSLSAFCFGAQLFKVWFLGMGLRVGSRRHLLLHALLATRFTFTQAMPTCRAPYFISVSATARLPGHVVDGRKEEGRDWLLEVRVGCQLLH